MAVDNCNDFIPISGTTSRGIIGVRDETAVELENIFDEVELIYR